MHLPPFPAFLEPSGPTACSFTRACTPPAPRTGAIATSGGVAAFTDMLDHGDAGYYPFCLILPCAWESGRDLVTEVRRNGPW